MESTVGEHGGNISKNMLEINITPEDHGAIIICEAINDELQESTHNAQTLSVKCKNFFSVKLFLGCAGSVGRLETMVNLFCHQKNILRILRKKGTVFC